MTTAYLLIVLSIAGGPQFVIPQTSLEACMGNQAEMTVLMNPKAVVSGCWDMGTQSFVKLPHPAPPPPEGEEVN